MNSCRLAPSCTSMLSGLQNPCVCVHPDSKLWVLARHVLREIVETIAEGAEAPIQTPLLTKLVCMW